jgi:hypothetical protein
MAAAAAPTWGNFVKWGSALAVLTVVGVMASHNDASSGVVVGVMWLAVFGAAVYFYVPLTTELSTLTGLGLAPKQGAVANPSKLT